MKLKFENNITPQEYNILRKKVGWSEMNLSRVEKALKENAFIKKATIDNKPVAMARAMSDGMYAFIADVVVSKEYQSKGIGKKVIEELIKEIQETTSKEIKISGEKMSIYLVSVNGKEEFYKKCGFNQVPYDYTGYGMRKEIKLKGE